MTIQRPHILLLLLLGCDNDQGMSLSPRDASEDAGDIDYDADADTDSDTDADSDADIPSEDETDRLQLVPAATEAYVFVTNPDRDTLTRIAMADLAVDTLEVGDIPTRVLTSATASRAVTLDEGSDTVSILDTNSLAITTVAIRDNMNSLSLSPTGAYAMAWYDPEQESRGTSEGIVSFNEVSFIDLARGLHFPMAVGYNPSAVHWSDSGALAVVVSDVSVAVVDLTAETPSPRLIELDASDDEAPAIEEVVLAPADDYAFVRRRGEQGLLLVDLASGSVELLTVGLDPTDMDVTPDGDHLVVVARGARELWQLDLADPTAAALVSAFPSDRPYGSITFGSDGTLAVLYTNAVLESALAIWDPSADTWTERSLVKPVSAVGISPAGTTAMVFHTLENAEDMPTDDPFYDRWAMTLVDTDSMAENRLLLEAEPIGYTVSDDNRWGFFIMENQSIVEALSFESLIPTQVTLASVPEFVGALPGQSVAWASQEHDLGRLSFYDPDANSLNTITGFELNSEIDH